MNCPRCNGTMVGERMIDMLDDSGRLRVRAWRCVACGEVQDPVIMANRARRPEADVGKFARRRRARREKKSKTAS
ncbi:MAG: hypothetical protein ACE5FN_09180 [Leptospirillia bacterium]